MRRYGEQLLIIAIILTFLIAGCGKKQVPVPTKPQIQPGGTLVYGLQVEPVTLNPFLSDMLATAEVSSLIFSGLVSTDSQGQWTPDLAAEIPTVQNGGVSPDGRTVTYKLRQGVKWHDGVEFTAADVKFTWQLLMNPAVKVISREGYDKIAAVDTPDKYTVVVRFREYYPPFLSLFSTILPAHLLNGVSDINNAPFNRAPVGTGPFKFQEWKTGESITLVANDSYWRGRPNLDSIVCRFLPDPNIVISQLKTGQVDMVSDIDFTMLDQVRSIDGIQPVISPSMVWEHLDFNLDNPLFQDVRVRQAIALSIDRPGLIAATLKGVASPAAGDQSPLSWAYNPALVVPSRDVNSARALLQQAGWQQGPDGVFVKNGRSLSFSLITTAGNRTREIVAQNIQQQLREAGIDMAIQTVEPQVFFHDVLPRRHFAMAMFAWVAGVDPLNITHWHSRYIPGPSNGYTGQNYPGWRNPEVDRLTEQGAQAVDLEQRKQAYFRIQDLIAQDYPVIPLYFRASITAVRNTVVNYQPNPTPSGNLWNAWQWGLTQQRPQ